MPRTRSLAWSELKIGIMTIAAVVIAAVTIFILTGDRGFPWQRYPLKTQFASAPGLKKGSPVRVAGVEVGTVTGVSLSGDQVDVSFEVNEEVRDRITTGSLATLGSVSLLGESAVDITASIRGAPIPDWGYVPQGRAAVQLSDITTQVGQSVDELTGLLEDVRAGRGTVGRLVTDEQLYLELRRFAASAGELTEGLKQGRGTLGRLLNDRRAADALEASLASVEALTRRIEAGEGSLGKLLKDDAFSRSLTAATANIEAVAGRLKAGEGTAGRLLTDPALFNRLNSVSERLDRLVTRLNEGEGTAGQLLKDTQLYENMNRVTTEISSLLAEIRKDPRKYLTLRVSIF